MIIGGSQTSTDAEEKKEVKQEMPAVVTKSSPVFLVKFALEIIVVACLSALAYFLRFDDASIFEPFLTLIPCSSFLTRPTKNPLPKFFVSDNVFVYVLFAAPLCGILIGESLRWVIGSPSSKVVMIRSHPLGQFPRRLIRFAGCFYFGFLLTSIITDMVGYLVSRPSPTFFINCAVDQTICSNPNTWVNITQCQPAINPADYEEFFRSFPNYRSAVSAYAATYMAWYSHALLKFPGSYILGPLITGGWIALSLLASLSDLAVQRAYWEDVALGLALGVVIAVYIVLVIHFFYERHDEIVAKYRQFKSLATRRVSLDDKTLIETLSQDDMMELEQSQSKYIPRIQAFNVGFQSNETVPVVGLINDRNETFNGRIRTANQTGTSQIRSRAQAEQEQQMGNPNNRPFQRSANVYNSQGYQQQAIRAYEPHTF